MFKKTLFVIACSLGVSATAGAAPTNKDWGALAFSSPHARFFGWKVDGASKEAAEHAALEKCNAKEAAATNGNRSCKIHEWFHGECGALAVHPAADGTIDKFGWAHAPTRPAAELAAMEACQASGGTACRIEVWACNKD
ncbi:MAG TPA: DUF4189 domain-containing protein [Labilithrix sp.]|jgi:hypothetical protein